MTTFRIVCGVLWEKCLPKPALRVACAYVASSRRPVGPVGQMVRRPCWWDNRNYLLPTHRLSCVSTTSKSERTQCSVVASHATVLCCGCTTDISKNFTLYRCVCQTLLLCRNMNQACQCSTANKFFSLLYRHRKLKRDRILLTEYTWLTVTLS